MKTEPDRLVRWDRFAAIVLLGTPALVVFAAAMASSGATRIYTWPWAFYVQLALLGPWLWGAWSTLRGHSGLRAGWTLSLPLLGVTLLAVLASRHWHDALEGALPLAAPLVLVPFAAEAWMHATPSRRRVAVRILGLSLTALAGMSIASWVLGGNDLAALVRGVLRARNAHTLGHWNYTGGLALLTLPAVLLLAWRERGAWRAAWLAATAVAVLQLISSGSRGAVLGVIAAAVVVVALIHLHHGGPRRRLLIGVGVLGVIVTGAVATNARLQRVFRDPTSLLEVGESEQQRLGFVLTGIRIAQAHPWVGIGPGTTPHHYPEFRVDRPGTLENSFQLHCGPVQWWADTGGIGLAVLAGVAGVVLLWLWRARRTLTPEGTAASGMLAGYGALWLTDYQLDVPIFGAVLGLGASVLVAETQPQCATEDSSMRRGPILGSLLAAVGLATALLLLPAWRARAEFSAAWTAKDENRVDAFLGHLRAAAEAAPWQPLYYNHLARALAGIATHLPPQTAAALEEEAANSWRHSIVASPAQDHPWINLGWLALRNGNTADAASAFATAVGLYPRRTGLWFGIALTRHESGVGDAAQALAREIRINPAFITSPLWRVDPFRELQPQVLEWLTVGWTASAADPGAGPDAAISAFARWWWHGTVNTPQVDDSSAVSPTHNFLGTFEALNDPEVRAAPSPFGPMLSALRETWRNPAAVPAGAALPPDLATAWQAHVQAHRDQSFTELLRSFPGVAQRQVRRNADGILFRQTDGDPLTDLTELPVAAHLPALALVLPKPAVEEFLSDAKPGTSR